MFAACVWLLNTLILCDSPGPASPIATLADGSTLAAPLVAIDDRWQLSFATEGSRRVVQARELVEWGAPADPAQEPLIMLSDGGLLAARSLRLDQQRLTLESALLGRLELPRNRVAAILLQPPADIRTAIGSITGQDRDDVLLLTNGDRLSGSLLGLDEKTARIRAEVGSLGIELARIAAVQLHAVLSPIETDLRLGSLRVWLGLRDGSRLQATSLLWDERALSIIWQGPKIVCLPAYAVWLQPRGGRVVYLSDLQAADYRHVPYLSLSQPYQRDRSLDGTPMRCHGRLYAKGLAMPSASRISYRVPADCRCFAAELGLDDETGGRGSVRFRVFVNGNLKYHSPIVRGGDPPLPVSVELDNAARLDLVVDFGQRADVLDHAEWLNARLIR